MNQPYPQYDKKWIDKKVEREMVLLQQIIGSVRNIRGEMNVPPSKEADLIINTHDEKRLAFLSDIENELKKLARIGSLKYNAERAALSASDVVQGIEIYMPLAELIDVQVEKNLQKNVFSLFFNYLTC